MIYFVWVYIVSVIAAAFFNKDAIKGLLKNSTTKATSVRGMERMVIGTIVFITTFCPIVNTCFVMVYVVSFISELISYR